MKELTRQEYVQRLRPICKALQTEFLETEPTWERGAELVSQGLATISEVVITDPAPDTEILSLMIYLTAQMHRYGKGDRSNSRTRKILETAWREEIMPYDNIRHIPGQSDISSN
jgi:hypothetical protein